MKTLLICHDDAPLDRIGLARWLHATSELVGMIVLEETGGRFMRRVRREIDRVGVLRFLDVSAFRLYYRAVLAGGDRAWEERALADLQQRFPPLPDALPVLRTHSPNSAEAEDFVREHAPDVMIARCKFILKPRVFGIPATGTFVMHPGVCPEYRNAHGCFWALARDDLEKVGMTLLQIDEGVDTGPVYGYYSYAYDPVAESHVVIQHRTVLENLDEIAEKLQNVHAGEAERIDTEGRNSGVWGQPWLTRHLAWKRRARRRAAGGAGSDPSGDREPK